MYKVFDRILAKVNKDPSRKIWNTWSQRVKQIYMERHKDSLYTKRQALEDLLKFNPANGGNLTFKERREAQDELEKIEREIDKL